MDSGKQSEEQPEAKSEIRKDTVLTLGPGGIKGFCQLGSLHWLEENGLLSIITKYVGVSVGSIICTLLNIGFSVKEIVFFAIDNVKIIDTEREDFNILDIIKNFKDKMGFFSLEYIEKTLTDIINDRLGFIPTLEELHTLSGKELYIESFNLSKEKTVFFSYKTHPTLNCITPILLSIGIPIIFWKNTFQGDVYIDGAFGDPYPVLLFDDGKTDIIGIYVKTISDDKSYCNLIMYIHDIFHCLFHRITKDNIEHSSAKCLHLSLGSDIIDTIGTTVTVEVKARMIMEGSKATQEFFNGEPKLTN